MKPQASVIKKTIKRGELFYYWLQRPKFDGSQNCVGIDTETFYPIAFVDKEDIHVLKKICDACPFKQACYEYSLAHEPHGFWGGTTPPERDRIRKVYGWGLVPAEYIGEFFISNHPNIGTRV